MSCTDPTHGPTPHDHFSEERPGQAQRGQGPTTSPAAPAAPPTPRPDDLFDALIDKLGEVSLVWTDTFPRDPKGYAKLQKLIARYTYEAVRRALEAALRQRIVPKTDNAMPLLTALARTKAKDMDDQRLEDAEAAERGY